MSFNIRVATKNDAVLIADISRQTFYETFAADNTKEDMDKFLSQQFTRGKLILEVGVPENTFLLAYKEDEIAGYVKLRNTRPPSSLQNNNALEIARIYSMKHMIGTGVGKTLMQACVDLAKENGKEILWLGVWERNQRAIDFYTKWGFEKFAETQFLLGNDRQTDWLMQKTIR